jgi:hypothetical protein
MNIGHNYYYDGVAYGKNDVSLQGWEFRSHITNGQYTISHSPGAVTTLNQLIKVDATTGDLTITNGNLVVANGKGIDFSATANSGSTTTSELLNDYETGTWTAVLICGTSGTITLNSAPSSCMYTKIGRLVNVSGYIDVQSVSSPTGRLRITGFPFTQISDGVPVGVGYLNNTNAYTGFAIMLGNQSDGAYIDRNAGTGADAALDMSSAIKANSEIYFNLTYTTT